MKKQLVLGLVLLGSGQINAYWYKKYQGVKRTTNCYNYCQSNPPCSTKGRYCETEWPNNPRAYKDGKGWYCKCGHTSGWRMR